MLTYPVVVDLEAPLEVARWRPFFNWVLAFPQLIVASVLQSVAQLLAFIAFFAILFTGRYPPTLFAFVAMAQRYQWRVHSYAMGFREPYPPFEFETVTQDPGGDPSTFSVEAPEGLSRGLIFVKWLLAFPHYIVLALASIFAFFAWFAGAIAVLVTGRWPAGLRDYIVGVSRWSYRVTSYVYLMRDEYPPFSLL